MNLLLKEIQHNTLFWLLVFVPVVFAARNTQHDAHTLLFVLSVLAIVLRVVVVQEGYNRISGRIKRAVAKQMRSYLGFKS